MTPRLLFLASLSLVACATAKTEQPAAEPTTAAEQPPAPAVVVEPGPEPIENTAEALVAAADRITRVDLCDVETQEPIATLPPATLDKLRQVLRDAEINEGLSSEPAWEVILRVEVEGRPEPFIVQFVTLHLRVKPEDPWSLSIADESGDIDWRIRDIYVDYELELERDISDLLPAGTQAQPWRDGHEPGAPTIRDPDEIEDL